MEYKSQPLNFIFYEEGTEGPAGQGLSAQLEYYIANDSMFTPPSVSTENNIVTNLTDWYTKEEFFKLGGPWDTKEKISEKPYVWKIICIKTTNPEQIILAAGPILLSDLESATMAAAAQIEYSTDNEDDKIYASAVGKWCSLVGKTIIDGGTIITGSIGAEQINTSGLSAEYILVKDENDEILFEADGRESADPQNGSESKVSIGSWSVIKDKIESKIESNINDNEFFVTGLYSGIDDYKFPSLLGGLDSPLRFYSGMQVDATNSILATFMVLADGSLYASAAKFYGKNVFLDKDVTVSDKNGNRFTLGLLVNTVNDQAAEIEDLKERVSTLEGGGTTDPDDSVDVHWYYPNTNNATLDQIKIGKETFYISSRLGETTTVSKGQVPALPSYAFCIVAGYDSPSNKNNGWACINANGTYTRGVGIVNSETSYSLLYTENDTEYTITWDANGGIGGETIEGVIHNRWLTPPTVTKDGYKCIGWSTNKTASLAEFSNGIYVTSSKTYYAVWEKIEEIEEIDPGIYITQISDYNVTAFKNDFTGDNNTFTGSIEADNAESSSGVIYYRIYTTEENSGFYVEKIDNQGLRMTWNNDNDGEITIYFELSESETYDSLIEGFSLTLKNEQYNYSLEAGLFDTPLTDGEDSDSDGESNGTITMNFIKGSN